MLFVCAEGNPKGGGNQPVRIVNRNTVLTCRHIAVKTPMDHIRYQAQFVAASQTVHREP